MERVIVRREVEAVDGKLSGLHPVLQRIYAARQVQSIDEVNRELSHLLPFSSMLNIDKAAERLAYALSKQQTILIVGDFDTDGATSTALAVRVLRAFGGEFIDYLVPNRFEFGYGLTPEIVEIAKTRHPDLIVTVDNGITSIDGVAKANEFDIDVIVTDHHLPGEQLPEACAIVNPNQKGDEFPSKCMAGVGVIFYVLLALRAKLKTMNWFQLQGLDCPNMTHFLDIVALGTVADVVPLDKNNRILVYQGLQRIRSGLGHPGIVALLEMGRRLTHRTVAADLGFAVAPRLNAAGRLDDMSLGVACLLSDDAKSAADMAKQLDELNRERRAIETKMQEEAFDIVESLDLNLADARGLCLYDKSWHQGVVGLVASRIKEKLHRPVIVFAKTDNDILKGSARSIKGLHIRDVLDAISTKNPGMVIKFGGHAMAAGLSIGMDQFDAFKAAFAQEVSHYLSEADLCGQLESDGNLDSQDFVLELAELLRHSGPWGQGFPEPLFDGVFELIGQRIVGERHLKLILRHPGEENYLDAIAFHVDLDKWPNYHCKTLRIAYRLDINEYRERKRLQLLVEDLQAETVQAETVQAETVVE